MPCKTSKSQLQFLSTTSQDFFCTHFLRFYFDQIFQIPDIMADGSTHKVYPNTPFLLFPQVSPAESNSV